MLHGSVRRALSTRDRQEQAFWIRNHSRPGVLWRVQYSRGWSVRICAARPDDEDHQKQIEKVLRTQPCGEGRRFAWTGLTRDSADAAR